MNGDEVRNVKFGRGTYDASQVDDLLVRVAAELDAGRPTALLIAGATFRLRLDVRRGYDTRAVDWFLEQLRRQEDHSWLARMNADPWRDLASDPYYVHREPADQAGRVEAPSRQECADEWRDFGQQPGTRLSWVRAEGTRRELRSSDQQAIASLRGGLPGTCSAGGRIFTWKRVTRSSWPGIADSISRDRPGAPAHILKRQPDDTAPSLRQLLDEIGMPILYTGGRHIGHTAGAYIKFPGHRWLRFPVRGAKQASAIMTAVDQAGNKVARYRLTRNQTGRWKTTETEITVHPDQQLTDELALAIAVSARWLRDYFRSEGGGG